MVWNNNNSNDIKTEFNSNLIRLISFNKLLDDCNDFFRLCSYGGNNIHYLQMLKDNLIIIYDEVYPKLKPDENTLVKNLFAKQKMIGSIYEYTNTPSGKVQIINSINFKKHKCLLSHISKVLRKLADKKGMLMTNKEQETDIWEDNE